ncbi:MAG TPA: VOC family protein [Solirubrobacterales bacterium]
MSAQAASSEIAWEERIARPDEEFLTHGPVHLEVTDVGRSLAFWRDLLGLAELDRAGAEARLGAGGRELVVLHAGAERGPLRGHTGLYHLALHLPDEGEFARVLARLMAARYPQAPTDHIFSKATYLDDPDGIGLELTLETVERVSATEARGGNVAIFDREGRPRRPVEPLDVEEVLAQLGDRALDAPLPAATRVGHVHLHVADLEAAWRFYRDLVGFEEHMFLLLGMADLSAGGRFPHRLALNVWQGQGALPPPPGTAGLRHFTLVARDRARLEAIRGRLGAAGLAVRDSEDGFFAADPSGNRLELRAGA